MLSTLYILENWSNWSQWSNESTRGQFVGPVAEHFTSGHADITIIESVPYADTPKEDGFRVRMTHISVVWSCQTFNCTKKSRSAFNCTANMGIFLTKFQVGEDTCWSNVPWSNKLILQREGSRIHNPIKWRRQAFCPHFRVSYVLPTVLCNVM